MSENANKPDGSAPAHTAEWWLGTSIDLADGSAVRCRDQIGIVVQKLTGGDCDGAKVAAELAHEAAVETTAALAGVKKFWGLVLPRVKRHPLTFGGGSVAVAVLIAAGVVWACPSVGATGSDGATVEPVEVKLARLIEAGEYDTAKVVADHELPAPECWHYRGEIERASGDEGQAKLWYERAAAGGCPWSQRAITAKVPSRPRCTE